MYVYSVPDSTILEYVTEYVTQYVIVYQALEICI